MLYYEKGLLGGGGGLTKLEVKRIAEETARKVAAEVVPPQAGAPGAPPLPLLREVETYPDGSPIVGRDGGLWRSHTCAYCANSTPPRWPGHHPKQCDRNPDTVGWRDGL